MFCEGFHFVCSDFDPGVIHIPEPVARSSSREVNQGSVRNLLHVEVGHYCEHLWAHATAELL